MRRLIAGPLVTLALCSTSAHADAATDAAINAVLEKYCASIAELTEAIAINHQKEVSLSTQMAALDLIDARPDIRASHLKLILTIYNTPRYSTEANQQRAINELRDRAHVECMMEVVSTMGSYR